MCVCGGGGGGAATLNLNSLSNICANAMKLQDFKFSAIYLETICWGRLVFIDFDVTIAINF